MAQSAQPLFIGIKELYYCEPATTKVTPATIAAAIKDSKTKRIMNSHQDTFSYEQEDGEYDEYINELTGEVYFEDPKTLGKRTINCALGEYDFEDKAALQGGELEYDASDTQKKTPIGWSSPESPALVYKQFIAKLKTGNYVIFANGQVKAKVSVQQKNLALGLTITAHSTGINDVKSEYWYTGASVAKALQN